MNSSSMHKRLLLSGSTVRKRVGYVLVTGCISCQLVTLSSEEVEVCEGGLH